MVFSFILWQHLRIQIQSKEQPQYIRGNEIQNNNLQLTFDERILYVDVQHKNTISMSSHSITTAKTTNSHKPRVTRLVSLQYEPYKSDSAHRRFPRLKIDTAFSTTEEASFHLFESSIPTSGHFIEPSWYTPNAQDLLWDNHMCKAMYPWQLEGFPNCNNLHELDMLHMKVINTGGSRIAFEMNQYSGVGTQAKFVYKTVKYDWDISMGMIDQQRKDALVMERASSSNFIPNLYGYCSLGLVMDFMPEGNMQEYLKGARLAKKRGDSSGILSPVDKLRVAIHIASSVRDLHETGDVKEIPAFFHNDICCHQFLFQQGIFKLNDFNHAQPNTFTKNKMKNELCLRDWTAMRMWKGRSFEEHLRQVADPRLEPFRGDKTDIYQMGNLLYTILTELYLFEEPELLTVDETTEALVAGKRSPYPSEIKNSTNTAHVAVKAAIDLCWIEKWDKRPSAREISEYLMEQLRAITEEANPDLRVTLPERDPEQTPSDGEYYEKTWNYEKDYLGQAQTTTSTTTKKTFSNELCIRDWLVIGCCWLSLYISYGLFLRTLIFHQLYITLEFDIDIISQ